VAKLDIVALPEIQKTLKHNVLFNLLDGAFFGFGIGFGSFTMIIPLFVSNMTNSALLIGLIPAIHNVGWQLPNCSLRIGSVEWNVTNPGLC